MIAVVALEIDIFEIDQQVPFGHEQLERAVVKRPANELTNANRPAHFRLARAHELGSGRARCASEHVAKTNTTATWFGPKVMTLIVLPAGHLLGLAQGQRLQSVARRVGLAQIMPPKCASGWSQA